MLARSSGGLNLGGGQDAHLGVVNSAGGYDLRGVVGFTFPAGFWDDMRQVTSVYIRFIATSSTVHVAKGASASALIYRVIAGWSQNSAAESWTTSPIAYPGPAVTTAGGITAALPNAHGAGTDSLINDIGMAWAPNSVLGPSGSPGGGAVCYGVALHETGGAAQAAEIWAGIVADAGLRPMLIYNYTSNAPPNPPTLIRPVGPDQTANIFEAQGADPEGDAITHYDCQVSTDPAFSTVTHLNIVNHNVGISAAGLLSITYASTAGIPLVNGTRYYWRVRMKDSTGSGAFSEWSSTATFVKSAGGGPADDLYDYWMNAILADMSEGRRAVRIGTLRPTNEQVAALVCAEFGDLFALYWDETTPIVSESVYILGERVSLSPDGWAVDAIVELKREVG
jgi:hypothetical protein